MFRHNLTLDYLVILEFLEHLGLQLQLIPESLDFPGFLGFPGTPGNPEYLVNL
jgi:hypothetical protein